MLLTIAVGCGWALRRADTARIMLGMTIVYGLGVALASLWNTVDNKPVKEAYLAVFGIVFLGSTLLTVLDRISHGRAPVVLAPR